MLKGLGYTPVVAFEKHCRNYRCSTGGRSMLATLVRVPKIGCTFTEVRTLVDEHESQVASGDVRAVPGELGIEEKALTAEGCTDAVAASRQG
ncbi:hypothetical protein [Streptomyces sp. RPT161]|uniref:hypothetical protein n=1 Tax=Streptomyces sp. RPT161 TaxID=3015993 RepID=UPI0022B8E5E4|nr:hypothetical protein [Streptomyces sp. RPT161]